MRIGIDAHMLGDHSGGNESYYTNILTSMKCPQNDEIIIFVKKGIPADAYASKFQIVEFKERSPVKRNFVELPRLCQEYRLDLLHTQYFIPFHRPCPVVCTIHDICFEHFNNIFTKKEYYTQKLLIPYAAKHSKYIFTVSQHAKHDIMEHYHIPENRIVVTYNAVSSDFRKLEKEELNSVELRNRYGISKNYILSVGNLQPRKNLVRLIKAFRVLKSKTRCEEQLVIVGKKAWLYNDILQEALKGSRDVIFTDYVNQQDLIRLYNDAECFIYPSFFEGFGIPPLEAMACGTVVAAANTTSLPEVVGGAGIYFDPYNENEIAEAMELLLHDKALRQKLKEKNKEQVNKFSWAESSEIISRYYHLAVNRNKNSC